MKFEQRIESALDLRSGLDLTTRVKLRAAFYSIRESLSGLATARLKNYAVAIQVNSRIEDDLARMAEYLAIEFRQ
jgi:hypothetical protein